jgi:gluconokinase
MVLKSEKSPPKFIVSGGIQKSPSGLQRLANVLGQPVYPNDEPEASLRGAAVFAMQKLGLPVPDTHLKNPVRPQQKIAKLYAIEREKQSRLESALQS